MDKQQYIHKLAIAYFEGRIGLNQEKELFDFINSNNYNLHLFREWEKEWLQSSYDSTCADTAWRRLEFRIKTKESIVENLFPHRFNFKRIFYVAATVLLFIGFSYYGYNYYRLNHSEAYFENEVPYGEKSKILLADGSIVWLNSGSTLKYSTSFNNKNRSVILDGEGYFEITKQNGVPFKVCTKGYDIVVKGTKFNVTAYGDDEYVSTTLVEGRVEINYKDKVYAMSPGEEIKLNKKTGKMQKSTINASHINSWINNVIEYDNITLQELMAKLSRRFNASITIRNSKLNDYTFNISLRNDETLDQILNGIQKIVPIQIQKEDQKYTIH